MKKNITLLLAVFLGSVSLASVHAQDADCSTNLSIFNEHAKVKNYDAAYEPWLVVYNNCPELHLLLFITVKGYYLIRLKMLQEMKGLSL